MPSSTSCPCGLGDPYARCCEPLHDRVAEAATAEQLMRSRYSAYARRREDHLFRTWHPRTRPERVVADPDTQWLGLVVEQVHGGGLGEDSGTVAFRARWRSEHGTGELVERSRFVRRRALWVYLSPDEEPIPVRAQPPP